MTVCNSLAMRNWLGELGLAAATVSGGDITGEVQSLTLQDENPRYVIRWLCLAMTLLKALFFCEQGLPLGWC